MRQLFITSSLRTSSRVRLISVMDSPRASADWISP